jgi:hypothetical protein
MYPPVDRVNGSCRAEVPAAPRSTERKRPTELHRRPSGVHLGPRSRSLRANPRRSGVDDVHECVALSTQVDLDAKMGPIGHGGPGDRRQQNEQAAAPQHA